MQPSTSAPEIQLAEVDSAAGIVTPANGVLAKPARSPELIAALASPLGRRLQDWSMMPVMMSARPTEPGEPSVVIFRDARFVGGFSFFGDRIPLTGVVELEPRAITWASQSMDGAWNE